MLQINSFIAWFFNQATTTHIGDSLRCIAVGRGSVVSPPPVDVDPLGHQSGRGVQTLVLHVLEATELLHLQVSGHLVAVEAVGVFLLWAVQLLAILVHMLQHPAADRRGQLEPHLPGLPVVPLVAVILLVLFPLELLDGSAGGKCDCDNLSETLCTYLNNELVRYGECSTDCLRSAYTCCLSLSTTAELFSKFFTGDTETVS